MVTGDKSGVHEPEKAVKPEADLEAEKALESGSSVKLEIAVQDIAGISAAADHGADRAELCQALAVGGLTPTVAMVERSVAEGLPAHPLIRPRAGGYEYSAAEVSAMVRDVEVLLEGGAEGVVVGALTENTLDSAALETLVHAAQGRPVVVHRCVDVLLATGAEPAHLVEELIDLGVSGVLTSGGAPRAVEGTASIAALSREAAGRLEIVAGGGVRVEDVPVLVRAGADVVHLSAGTTASAGNSGPGGVADTYATTDPDTVAAVRAAVNGLTVP